MLELWLVRHAPTRPNAERRYPRPDEDAPTSEDGHALAVGLRGLLPAAPDRVLTSPARRCRDTARHAGHGGAVVTPELREADFGVMAGHTWAELEERFGPHPHRWIEGLGDPASPHGPPEGESGEAFHGRVAAWLGTLPEEGRVLAFTHAGPVRAALRLTVGLSAVDVRPAGVTTLCRAGGAWWLTALNVGAWPPHP